MNLEGLKGILTGTSPTTQDRAFNIAIRTIQDHNQEQRGSRNANRSQLQTEAGSSNQVGNDALQFDVELDNQEGIICPDEFIDQVLIESIIQPETIRLENSAPEETSNSKQKQKQKQIKKLDQQVTVEDSMKSYLLESLQWAKLHKEWRDKQRRFKEKNQNQNSKQSQEGGEGRRVEGDKPESSEKIGETFRRKDKNGKQSENRTQKRGSNAVSSKQAGRAYMLDSDTDEIEGNQEKFEINTLVQKLIQGSQPEVIQSQAEVGQKLKEDVPKSLNPQREKSYRLVHRTRLPKRKR
eukprot:TRINITY_DN1175_c1_g2_i3.p1 TRINITY_DN1175_c1_g2~~TRINITY_DN1175_c1_g2_i3.p1  ORF type:complete len:295 (-),score=57.95 TRINITY_DN1175_c1_g2_i3:43-927(-)